jgi:hypothetical protein
MNLSSLVLLPQWQGLSIVKGWFSLILKLLQMPFDKGWHI